MAYVKEPVQLRCKCTSCGSWFECNLDLKKPIDQIEHIKNMVDHLCASCWQGGCDKSEAHADPIRPMTMLDPRTPAGGEWVTEGLRETFAKRQEVDLDPDPIDCYTRGEVVHPIDAPPVGDEDPFSEPWLAKNTTPKFVPRSTMENSGALIDPTTFSHRVVVMEESDGEALIRLHRQQMERLYGKSESGK